MHKVTSERLSVPPGGWISIGEQASFGPGGAEGSCGRGELVAALRVERAAARTTCARSWLYRAPLPRTKLTSPAPAATLRAGSSSWPDAIRSS